MKLYDICEVCGIPLGPSISKPSEKGGKYYRIIGHCECGDRIIEGSKLPFYNIEDALDMVGKIWKEEKVRRGWETMEREKKIKDWVSSEDAQLPER